jgi:hypothetical protein
MTSHTTRSPANRTALPLYVSLAPFDLCQHCGIISRPRVRVITDAAEGLAAHTRQMLEARPTIARYFAQGCERVTVVTCNDCSGIRGILGG